MHHPVLPDDHLADLAGGRDGERHLVVDTAGHGLVHDEIVVVPQVLEQVGVLHRVRGRREEPEGLPDYRGGRVARIVHN